MPINVQDIVRQAWTKAQAMPAEERFTAVSLLESIGPYLADTFWRDVQKMLRDKCDVVGVTRKIAGDEQPLIKGKSVESGNPKIGRVTSFFWAAED